MVVCGYSVRNYKFELKHGMSTGRIYSEAFPGQSKLSLLRQGGFNEPVHARYKFDVISEKQGLVSDIDNRKLARVAKLAGAPKSPSAGILFLSPLGKKVNQGEVLFCLYAESKGQPHFRLC